MKDDKYFQQAYRDYWRGHAAACVPNPFSKEEIMKKTKTGQPDGRVKETKKQLTVQLSTYVTPQESEKFKKKCGLASTAAVLRKLLQTNDYI